MRKFSSVGQAQRFLGAHAAVHNWFNLGRHLVSAERYRNLRISAFAEWGRAVACYQVADSCVLNELSCRYRTNTCF